MHLVERSIYRLPNGRELVAGVTANNKTILYNVSDPQAGEYELNAEGRLLFNGQLTAGELKDLSETGRVVSPAALLDAAHERQNTHEQRG